MKKTLALVLATIAAVAVAPAFANPNVGVSIGINQPGVYGRIDIGDTRPVLVYPQPVVVAPPQVVLPRQPIYLYVPPGHQKSWARYCGRYNACNQPVYFVQESWVRERYAHDHPGWREGRGPWRDGDRGRHDRDDYRDHGHGHGHDRGPGRGGRD